MTAVRTVLATLSGVLNGHGPVAPGDGPMALVMAAMRRGKFTFRFPATTTSTSQTTTPGFVEAETMAISRSRGGRVVSDSGASGGKALRLTSNSVASAAVNLPDSTVLVIRAKATLKSGAPNLTLSVDGVPVTTVVVDGTSWANYTFTGVIPAGSHVISIASSNSTSKRSLYIDTVTATTGSFVEDFTGSAGSSPSSTHWTANIGNGWDIGLETYQTANATLDGQGHLDIKATQSSTRDGYSSGWVDTKNKVSFGYGTITARIKVPQGQGLWPSFWMKGANEDTVPWPYSGEIDVLELPSTTTTITSTVHGPIAGSIDTLQAQIVSSDLPDLSTDYHDYWVRHLPNEITFGVDNITLGAITPDSLVAGSEWVYNQPMYVILNMAVGGSWAGAPDSTTQFPSSMLVDWMRWDPAV